MIVNKTIYEKREPLLVEIRRGLESDYQWKSGAKCVPLPNIFVMCLVANGRDVWDKGKFMIGHVCTNVYEHQGSDIVAMDYNWSFTAKPPIPYKVLGWHYIKPYDGLEVSDDDEY